MFGVSTRTLFLVVRGVYMGRPLKDLRKDLGDLDRDEKKLIRQQEQMKNLAYQQAYAQMFQGVAFVAFSSMALFAFTKVIEKSKEGKVFMDQFGKSIDNSLSRFGTAFLKILGPFLSGFAQLLDLISGFPPALYALTGLMTVGAMLLFVWGATKLLGGAWGILTLKQMTYAKTLPALNTQLTATQIRMNMLTVTANRAFMLFILMFTVVSSLKSAFGGIGAVIGALIGIFIALGIVIWHNALGMSILTAGIAAAAGIAGIVAALAIDTSMPTHQMGTTMVRSTGMAMVHAGEIIKSARESPDVGYMKTGGRTTYNKMDVHIEHVHTEAKFGDFKRQMRKELGEIMRERD